MTRRRSKIVSVAVLFAMAITISLPETKLLAQGATPPPAPVYNPYPPGILPSNLDSELARVLREVDGLEAEATKQWKALAPPVVSGQPPIFQNTGVASVEILGKLMNYDKTISPNENE